MIGNASSLSNLHSPSDISQKNSTKDCQALANMILWCKFMNSTGQTSPQHTQTLGSAGMIIFIWLRATSLSHVPSRPVLKCLPRNLQVFQLQTQFYYQCSPCSSDLCQGRRICLCLAVLHLWLSERRVCT